MKRHQILSRMVGNMFEPPIPMERAPLGPRGGHKGYLIGDMPVSLKMVESLRREGFVDGMRPTAAAVLWYQEFLRSGEIS